MYSQESHSCNIPLPSFVETLKISKMAHYTRSGSLNKILKGPNILSRKIIDFIHLLYCSLQLIKVNYITDMSSVI